MHIKYEHILCLVIVSLVSSTVYASLRVEATTQDVAAIAKAVGGEHIQVDSLTLGTRDPHFAVAKPSMIRRVHSADLLLVIGADMEIGWLPPLLQSARNSRVQPGNPGYVDLSRSVELLGKLQSPVDRAMGDVHAKGNPHYWLDPRNGVLMAKMITEQLIVLDPEHVNDYQTNLDAFTKRIDEKYKQWSAELKHLVGKSIIAYHTSFSYLANAFGFVIVDHVEPKPGISPSASSLNALITHIKRDQIKLIIMEPYYERRSAQYLNDKTGIQYTVIPQSVGAEPGIQTYTDLFDAVVKLLKSSKDL